MQHKTDRLFIIFKSIKIMPQTLSKIIVMKGSIAMQTDYELIIIGSGPAGLSAAIYAMRAKLDTLVIEKSGTGGGQVLTTYEVDNYPGLPGIGGFELGMKMKEHADKLNAKFMEADVKGIEHQGVNKKVITSEGEFFAKCIIIASGASYAKLSVKGEKELTGMGVSYCATCDGAFFRGKSVAVVGGGDVAVEDAIFLARICEKVYVIHRRDELRAAKSLQEALFALSNVEMIWESTVEQINGANVVESLLIYNKKTNEKKELPVQGVFVAVGIIPNSEVFTNVAACNEKGYMIAGEDCVTSEAGIFAVGDVRTKPLRQIVTAVSDGANAITSVQQYLIGK